MARPGAIRVDGARRLRRDLKAAGQKVTGVGLKEAHQDIAEIVVEAADVPEISGDLRRALKPVGTVASAIVRAGARAVPYGNPVHWGWASRGIRPNPFLLDAMDSRRGEIEDRYMHSLEKIIGDIKGTTKR